LHHYQDLWERSQNRELLSLPGSNDSRAPSCDLFGRGLAEVSETKRLNWEFILGVALTMMADILIMYTIIMVVGIYSHK